MHKSSWFYLFMNEASLIKFYLPVAGLYQVLPYLNTLWISFFVMRWQLTLNSHMGLYYLSCGVKPAKRTPEHTHILLHVQTKRGFQVTDTNGNTGSVSTRQTSWQCPCRSLQKRHQSCCWELRLSSSNAVRARQLLLPRQQRQGPVIWVGLLPKSRCSLLPFHSVWSSYSRSYGVNLNNAFIASAVHKKHDLSRSVYGACNH